MSTDASTSPHAPGPVPPEADWRDLMAAACAGLGMFLAALDIAVNVALPAITADFGIDLQTVQWIIVAFVATSAGLVMGAGSFADRFGLKPVFLLGTTAYLVSMVSIALSPTLTMVVGFRVLQAVGTGCLFAASPAIAARAFPAHRRGVAMGFVAASQAVGLLAGTLGAGLLVEWFGWQAVFLGRTPFTLAALLLGIWFLRRDPPQAQGRSFDVTGAVTLLAALLCLVIGLRLGRSVGWASPPVLVLLSLAPLFLVVFWRAEGRAAWPVLPRDLLRIRGFVTSWSSTFLAHLGVFVIWFIFPFYIADSLGRGPLTLGLMLATMASFNIGFSAVGGWLCDRVGPLPVGGSGLAILAAGLLAMAFLDGGSGPAEVGLRISIVGIGLGLFQAAAYTLMLGSVPPPRFGTAAAALSLAQSFGTVISVTTIGGIFALSHNYHLNRLADSGLPAAEQEGRAFILAFQNVFWLGAALAALAALPFLLNLRRKKGPAP
ncbi:MAG: MFS transporter [Chloroflexota bacterium]